MAGRALTIKRTVVPQSGRQEYLARLRQRKEYYSRAKCNFWVFEEAGLPGAFLEFTEAPDKTVLASAHTANPDPILDAARIYQEVELG